MSRHGGSAAVSLPVVCTVRSHKTAARVYDLAREGCLLDWGNGFIVAGDKVVLRFNSGVRLRGRVTLLHGRIARIEFDEALHDAIFAHLLEHEAGVAPPGNFQRVASAAGGARRLG